MSFTIYETMNIFHEDEGSFVGRLQVKKSCILLNKSYRLVSIFRVQYISSRKFHGTCIHNHYHPDLNSFQTLRPVL